VSFLRSLIGLAIGIGVLFAPQGAHAVALGSIFIASLTLGCLLLTLLQHIVHAKWGIFLLSRFEAGAGPWSIAAVGVAVLPSLLHPEQVYPWANGGYSAQQWWLSTGFFQLRTVSYIIIWAVLAFIVRRASKSGSYATNVAAPGFFVVWLTGSFAAVDWAMSLEAPFASSIYGLLFLAAGAMGAFGLCVASLCESETDPLFDRALRRDYGNLLLTMVMVWAYLSFMQYLICWSGNVQGEAGYFLRRAVGFWGALGDGLVGIGFFGPFLLLLSPRVRDSRTGLKFVGRGVGLVWAAFLFWLVGPSLPAPWWVDLLGVAAAGLLWSGAYSFELSGAASVREIAVA
jgi:hypothetical protein